MNEKQKLLQLSVSKLKTFKTCKAQYKFSYIDRMPKKDWEHLAFGKFAHDILERYHIKTMESNIISEQIMKESYQESLEVEEWKDKLTQENKDEAKSVCNEYLMQLQYLENIKKLPKVIEVEKKFKINVDDLLLLTGFIDKVQIDHDGVLHVADYKTSKSKSYLQKDFLQLKTYAYSLCIEDPDLERVRTSYVMLRHNCESIVKEFTRKQIMKVENQFIKYAEKIHEEKLWLPVGNNLCGYCDYIEMCSVGTEFMRQKNGYDNFGETDW